ncbi:hypothetical protein D3C72_1719160 [compost metagenome]
MRAQGIPTLPLSENSCGVASNTTSGETSIRTIGGRVTRSRSPLAAIRARQALISRQSASPDRLSCPCVVASNPSRVEVIPLKFSARRPSVISNGIQWPTIATLSNARRPNTSGFCALPPNCRLAFSIPAAFSPCVSIGLSSASDTLVILTLPLMVRRTCGSAI